MSNHSTTVRAATAQTIEDKSLTAESIAAAERVLDFWRDQTDASVLQAIEAHPSLVDNKTLLLDLILKEYKLRREEESVAIDEFCEQFHSLGSSLEHSIFRALEVQDYLDDHPELLELVTDFQWPSANECLEGFYVIEELGRGALARVYLCRESGLGQREVVVKVARGGGYEADLLGRLDHPNIMPVYSVTNDAQRYVSYICMPFRGRSTLQYVVDQIRKNGIPSNASAITDAAYLLDPVRDGQKRRDLAEMNQRAGRGNYVDGVLLLAIRLSDALAHAHDIGVYHGDLKPSNVLLTQDGKPLLIDFNLATDRQSGTAPRGGTLAYMPPEQLAELSDCTLSSTHNYDARSEVYSFGALIYQLLTGEVPFRAIDGTTEPLEAARQMLTLHHKERPWVRSKNSCVNAELERLVLSCLALSPADRPRSMVELHRRLQLQYGAAARFRRLMLTWPVTAAVLACASFAMLACGILYLSLRPPYHVRQLMQGTALQQSGDYQSALSHFDRALESVPKQLEARYERGRTHLLKGDTSAALIDFSHASQDFSDPRSAAYVGYCFNLNGNLSESIPWYEMALKKGLQSAGVHNNLAVSYARGRSRLGRIERLAVAERHLVTALELNESSPVIRGNLVMLALIRSDEDPAFKPESSLVHLEFLSHAIPNSPRVMTDAVQFYSLLSLDDRKYVEKALSAIESSLLAGNGPTARELSTNPRFDALREYSRFAKLSAFAKSSRRPQRPDSLVTFLDPVVGSGADTR